MPPVLQVGLYLYTKTHNHMGLIKIYPKVIDALAFCDNMEHSLKECSDSVV